MTVQEMAEYDPPVDTRLEVLCTDEKASWLVHRNIVKRLVDVQDDFLGHTPFGFGLACAGHHSHESKGTSCVLSSPDFS